MGKTRLLQRSPAPLWSRIIHDRQRRPRRARRYIDASLGVEKFFSILNDKGVDYVCLRWHEDLPKVKRGEDIDLLIGDAHLETVEPLLLPSKKKHGIPVDLYTESGLSGTDYCTVSYFLPELARSALQSPRLYKDLVKIPDAVSHFYTMCYHVVYHKGLASGLPERHYESTRPADHDYSTAISEMASAAGLPVPELTLFGLSEALERAGWKPASDTLRKYARKNPWLQNIIGRRDAPCDPDHDGLAVFLVRERASSQTPRILEFLEREGFAILETLVLDPEHGRRVAARIRGGNWSRGPWPVSGGPPAIAISAFDCFPAMEQFAENPFEYHNVRIQRAKKRLRLLLMKSVPETEFYNPVHSSDSPQEALEYLRIIDQGMHDRACVSARSRAAASRHPFAVKHRLDGQGRRAKLEVIEYGGGLAVCKTFRPGADRFLQRELRARELVSDDGRITAILEVGPNYFVTEYVPADERQLSGSRPFLAAENLLPVWAIIQCRDLIKAFRRQGYELIDFKPQNLIFDRRGGLKFIDFEFLQPGPAATASLAGNYAWWLPPSDFAGDYPELSNRRNPYATEWFKRTGVPRFVCAGTGNPVLLRVSQLLGWLYLSAANAHRAVTEEIRRRRKQWTRT